MKSEARKRHKSQLKPDVPKQVTSTRSPRKAQEGEEPEVVVPKTKTTGESSIGKGSVELYSYLNEVGCQYLKIPASQSIVLTKA